MNGLETTVIAIISNCVDVYLSCKSTRYQCATMDLLHWIKNFVLSCYATLILKLTFLSIRVFGMSPIGDISKARRSSRQVSILKFRGQFHCWTVWYAAVPSEL